MRRGPSVVTRLGWWLEDRVVEPARGNAKVLTVVLAVALLALGGLAARQVVRAQASTSTQPLVKLTTTVRQLVRVRKNGHTVVRWRVRRKVVYARAQTVLQTRTIHTPTGTRVVTRPVTRYHVIYRKHVVTVHGKTRTVNQPVTDVQTQTQTQTRTQTQTQTVRVTQPVTETQVRTTTQQSTTTVVQTTTVITTVTLPGTTVTVTVP
jgi:hypothetical protein